MDRHLPNLRRPDKTLIPGRKWRIIYADDHKPHLSPLVSRLCWERGYVFMPHGGGVTLVAQTVGTELSQPDYETSEAVTMIRHMQDCVVVPQLRPAECVDLMTEVLRDMP